MIVDLFHAPPWVRAQHPSSVAVDSTGRPYEHELSMFHPQATELATAFLRLVSGHLAHVYQGCAVGRRVVLQLGPERVASKRGGGGSAARRV